MQTPDYAIAVSLGNGWDVQEESRCMPLLPNQEYCSIAFDAYLAKLNMEVCVLWKNSAQLGGLGGRYRKGYIVRISHLRAQRNK